MKIEYNEVLNYNSLGRKKFPDYKIFDQKISNFSLYMTKHNKKQTFYTEERTFSEVQYREDSTLMPNYLKKIIIYYWFSVYVFNVVGISERAPLLYCVVECIINAYFTEYIVG